MKIINKKTIIKERKEYIKNLKDTLRKEPKRVEINNIIKNNKKKLKELQAKEPMI